MVFPEWLKNSGNAGAGQRRNGLRVRGIGSGWTGRESARGRLMPVLGRHVMPISDKGAPARHFSTENDRGRRFRGPKIARNGAGKSRGPKSEVRGRRCWPGTSPAGFGTGTARRPRRGGLQPIRRHKIGQNEPKTVKNGIWGRFGGSGGPEIADFQQENRKYARKQEGKEASSCFPVGFLFSCLVAGLRGAAGARRVGPTRPTDENRGREIRISNIQ